jgi:hypothetical protein
MFKQLIHQLKLLLVLIYDTVYRIEKYFKYLLTGKHEFERICEMPCDIYEKTMQMDRWLMRSKCPRIRTFFDNNLDYKLKCTDANASTTIDRILGDFKHDPSRRLSDAHHKTTPPKKERSADDQDGSGSALVNLEDGDGVLVDLLNSLTDELVRIILRTKRTKLSTDRAAVLRDIIYRIVSYHLSLVLVVKIASIKYDSSIPSHKRKLINLWNNLIAADEEKLLKEKESRAFTSEHYSSKISKEDTIVSSRWSLIGFQGEDPGTDFRGMGFLGLEQLEYMSRKSRYLARDLLKRSMDTRYEYPFAITGINITYNLVNLYKDGSMKHLYYDYGDSLFRNKRRNLNLIKTLNDLYVELYLRFDCFWRESKPENILVFNELMEEFVNIIKMDMETRNFSMKFIY